MIAIQNVCKRFGKLQVLNQIHLECLQGESIALIGPNGCGKTTMIKSILRMVLPDSGVILFDGKDIRESEQYRTHIGYMPQIGRYPDNMSVGQVIETIRTLRPQTTQLDYDLYEAYEMGKLKSKRMATLSGGTRQKVSAVLAFMFDPQVLILDEPTAGLDPIAAEILKDKILEARQAGKLILITSHLLNELDEIVTEVVMMQEGVVKFHQKTDELKQSTGKNTLAKAISAILKQGQQDPLKV